MLGLVFVISACNTVEDPPVEKPNWFKEMGELQGINLPHLADLTPAYMAHPTFASNMSGMGWNTYRLPITWDRFNDTEQVAEGILRLRKLVDQLRSSRRTFLILDFHQYHFGPVCGGDGIPRGAIDETGLQASDLNCMFLAFGRFWQNNNGVQDQWINAALPFIREAVSLQAQNRSWLSFGIEPFNEFVGSEANVSRVDAARLQLLGEIQCLHRAWAPFLSQRLSLPPADKCSNRTSRRTASK